MEKKTRTATFSPAWVCIISCISINAAASSCSQWTIVARVSLDYLGTGEDVFQTILIESKAAGRLWVTVTNHLITETCLCRFVDIWTPAVWEFPLSVFFFSSLFFCSRAHWNMKSSVLTLSHKHSGFCVYWLLSIGGRKSQNTPRNNWTHISARGASCCRTMKLSLCLRADGKTRDQRFSHWYA